MRYSPFFFVFALAGCTALAPASRYVVTASPIRVIHPGHPGLCVAVEPGNPRGVWWWDPGPEGCSTSINGPRVFPAQGATVAHSVSSGAIDVRFKLQLHSNEIRDVRLVIQDNDVRDVASGEHVPIGRRNDLDIPPAYGR